MWHVLCDLWRKQRIVIVTLLLAGLAVGLWLLARDPISERSFHRIRAGMTESEVEAILGGPAGDYRDRKTFGLRQLDNWGTWDWNGPWKSWLGNDLFVSVGFDRNGRVVAAGCSTTWHPEEALTDRVRRWLRRWIHS